MMNIINKYIKKIGLLFPEQYIDIQVCMYIISVKCCTLINDDRLIVNQKRPHQTLKSC